MQCSLPSAIRAPCHGPSSPLIWITLMNYTLISGIVQNLQISKGRADLMMNKPDYLDVVSALNTAFAENSPDSADSTEIEMEFFTCEVQNIRLEGRFYRVEFTEGDNIDFIIILKDGLGEVQCFRDRGQRLLWTLPYHTRGHIAQKLSDITHGIVISFLGSLLGTAIVFHNDYLPLDQKIIEMAWVAIPSFGMCIFVNYMVRKPFCKFSYNATEIFRTLNFSNPELMDLPQNNRKAQKEYASEFGRSHIDENPWKYRYQIRDLLIAPEK